MDENCDEVGITELRRKALFYYGLNGGGEGVTDKIESILNKMFYEQPKDIYGYLAQYFTEFAIDPVITQRHRIESDERENAESESIKSVERAVELIGTELSELVRDQKPSYQESIDSCLSTTFHEMQMAEEASSKEAIAEKQVIEEVSAVPDADKGKGKLPKATKSKTALVTIVPDEPPERLPLGCEAVSAVSQAVCRAAASLSGMRLFEYISYCRGLEKPGTFKLPLPIVTILSCGKGSLSKVRCVKEYMVIPSPEMSLKKAMKNFSKIYNFCAKSLAGKTTVASVSRSTNDIGALCPLFDRPEQGLDLIQEAIVSIGLVPGTDFHLAINCAGHEFLDYEKGKYEVTTGQLKSSEELVKFWLELVSKYPAIIMLIDPMRKQEKESWMQLADAVSSRCYVVGDYVYHRPGRLRNETLPADLRTSGVVLYMHHINTVTDVLTCVRKMEENGNKVVIGCSPGETSDTFATDLAVGCQARFLKLGGLNRGERVAKMNRLLEIESELESSDQLDHWGSHVFNAIKLAGVDTKTEIDGPLSVHSISSPSPEKNASKKHK